ncbi:dipeptidyl-peptidase 3 family protein [Rhodopirellula sp. MGV]|uniref:dipeptidyl-peptidase 3 family protein n=1 Tax=Rhodopirellula sp. MGV TaxID=2023130 RepID=UPI000B974576|nr:peptidase M49 [Rhodopirellula sp. MGV]OYP32981.1 peptidase M49 [Rhodopirellula sp. MGV]PNY35361.1 peptidase M49 [Rhodopirellula baltica]
MRSISKLLATLTVLTAWHPAIGQDRAPEPNERQYLLDRVDDVAIVQLYVDGFEQLPLREKALIYHLSQAAIAGRDIYIDQRYRYSLTIRTLLEGVLEHPQGIDKVTLSAIEKYMKLFWVNNGPHSSLTAQKNLMECDPESLEAAIEIAIANGALMPEGTTELEPLLDELAPVFFDEDYESHVTQKSPADGRDILVASANNFYENVTMQDIEGFREQYPLNSRVVKQADGQIVEQVYRMGLDEYVPAGLYAKQITGIVDHLEAAIPYATPQMAQAIGALIHFYKTGDARDFYEYNIAWVDDKDSPVDTINGFIEVYVDARGMKGAWEAVVYFNDPVKMDMIRKFADNAQWFEDHMPYDQRFRKANVKGISAKAIQVVMETGDSGPVTPIGINLPNDPVVRQRYGSKSVSLSNVMEAYDKSGSKAARSEFCFDEAEAARADKWKTEALALEVNMHEVIGHASGQVNAGVEPAVSIKEYYSALEEGRADLVALYFIGNEKLIELGLVANEADLQELQLAAYEAYTRNAMTQLRRIKTGTTIEEDHMRNRQMIVGWLAANTSAIQVDQRDGKTFFRVADVKAWHAGVGRLLAEVQRIKSEGDRASAERLMKDYAININIDLRDEVLDRYADLDPPAYTGFVQPTLTAVTNDAGEITDVQISYPLDLKQQMLDWSPEPAN